MNTKNISFIISFLFTSLIGFNINAQGIMIHKNSGTPIQVPYSDLDSIVTYEDEPPALTGAIAEAIDLGLPSGTKWASWNVGAFSPEEYGGYYAWGEIEEKEDYTETTYLHYDNAWQEYINIGENISESQYDVARRLWGADWRMPSKAEFEELVSECTWTWIQYNNLVSGYKIVGPNGNRIFLPAAGGQSGTSPDNTEIKGYYWSSLPSENNKAWRLHFGRDSQTLTSINRFFGFTVRPVK